MKLLIYWRYRRTIIAALSAGHSLGYALYVARAFSKLDAIKP